MSDCPVHYGGPKFDLTNFNSSEPWRIFAECGALIKEEHQPTLGMTSWNLAKVTCPKCQEMYALQALQEFT